MNKINISNKAYRQVAAAISLLVFFIVAYLYFLNISVVHVVMRKEADQQQGQLRAEIATLETRYIEAQHEISSRIATIDRQEEEIPKLFVTRSGTDKLVRAN